MDRSRQDGPFGRSAGHGCRWSVKVHHHCTDGGTMKLSWEAILDQNGVRVTRAETKGGAPIACGEAIPANLRNNGCRVLPSKDGAVPPHGMAAPPSWCAPLVSGSHMQLRGVCYTPCTATRRNKGSECRSHVSSAASADYVISRAAGAHVCLPRCYESDWHLRTQHLKSH